MSRAARFLVVDDERRTRGVHARLISALGFEVETAADGTEALAKIVLDIDLVLLDAEMPGMDGFELVERIRSTPAFSHLPIVMLTGLVGEGELRRAYEAGVNDFLQKPLDPDVLLLRSRWLLNLKQAHDELQEKKELLEGEVDRRTRELRSALDRMTEAQRTTRRAHLDTINRLTVAAEYKDLDTAGHIDRIGRFSEILARELGLAPGRIETIRHASPMHDVGKLAIPDHILLKPGPLEEAEWVVMKSHTTRGADLLADSDSPVIRMGEAIARSHHEQWGGAGYPDGLSGEQIPLEGRICAVVDYFDALTSDRPYRGAVPSEKVLEMMEAESGTRFDPEVFQAFTDAKSEILDAQSQWTSRGGQKVS